MMKRLLPLILLFTFNQIQAQDTGEDLWGNWLMYFGTNRVSDKLSIHTEAQYRLYEFSDNFNQLLLRTGLNYHIADHAMATAGYAFIPTRTFAGVNSSENRIWQQFILRNKLGPVAFEHRYRLEQRWVQQDGVTTYSDRARYRLFFTIPLNKPKIEPETFFLAFYDEVFINITENPFSQNRLFGAVGYAVNKNLSFQVGYLRNRLGPNNFNRVQFAVFFNPDFRKDD
ncbi:MAG: DUF2490 domain-containing protein [Bacteroidota bacterium]